MHLLWSRANGIALKMASKSNGERLREWREAQGLSQAQAAARIGAKQGTWAPWESGKKCPSVGRANQLAELTAGAVPVSGWSPASEMTGT